MNKKNIILLGIAVFLYLVPRTIIIVTNNAIPNNLYTISFYIISIIYLVFFIKLLIISKKYKSMDEQEIKGRMKRSLLLLLCNIIIMSINECERLIVFARNMYNRIPLKDFKTMFISYFSKNFSITEVWVVCLCFFIIIGLIDNIKNDK